MNEYLKEKEDINPDTIAYIDEMGVDTFIYREYAYSKRGVKVIGHISGKKYQKVGLVAAKMGKGIIAPLQYKGSMDSALFEYWFEFCLVPALAPNSTVILDNASFHNKRRLSLLAEKYGYKIIFLPPYSPDLNPIENFFGILKSECIYRQKLQTFDEAHNLIDEYIFFYNHERIQLKTKLTPCEKRCQAL